MLDSTLRPLKDSLLAPLARGPLRNVPPIVVSLAALGASLGAAVAAWQGAIVASVALWLLGRALDGLDGVVARVNGRQSDLGGLYDFLFDTIGYAAIPLGLAAGVNTTATWIATAVVLSTFYLNAVSLGHVAAMLEKRSLGAAQTGAATSTILPRGLVEGTETVIFFTVALALPASAWIVWTVMAAAVSITVIERTRWIARRLGTDMTTSTDDVGVTRRRLRRVA
jgi:phosphatidylglycerophosphate synthase